MGVDLAFGIFVLDVVGFISSVVLGQRKLCANEKDRDIVVNSKIWQEMSCHQQEMSCQCKMDKICNPWRAKLSNNWQSYGNPWRPKFNLFLCSTFWNYLIKKVYHPAFTIPSMFSWCSWKALAPYFFLCFFPKETNKALLFKIYLLLILLYLYLFSLYSVLL